MDSRDLGLDPDALEAPLQRPFAVVIGCSDARVPIELIFNEGPNDLFVIRIAGNGLGEDVLGSLKYAVEHLQGSLQLIVILAHSSCGAMIAAVDAFLAPSGYLALATSHSLRAIVDRQLIVIQTCASAFASRLGPEVVRCPGYRNALIEASIVTNAALTAFTVQQEFGKHGPASLRAVFGVYLLQGNQIWAPRAGTPEVTGLADPPSDLASFQEFGTAIITSERIKTLLNAE